MNFKAYDILATLIPGFLGLLVALTMFEMPFQEDLIVAYTALAFLLGYLINTFGSWLEDFYYFTWGGNPSAKLLNGHGIWKVRFYEAEKVKDLLKKETSNEDPSDHELFSIAMRFANSATESRINDFNASYAFSRNILTTVLIGTMALLISDFCHWQIHSATIAALIVVWLRCKQRNYYYCKEVLSVFLKIKIK